MRYLFLTSILLLITTFTFAQNKPVFTIEQSNKGYELFLQIDDLSNVESVSIKSSLIQNNKINELFIKLSASDLINHKSFQKLSLENVTAEYIVEITNNSGIKTSYPLVRINVTEELFASN